MQTDQLARKELHFFEGMSLYRGQVVNTPHAHPAVQITISRGRHKMCLALNGRVIEQTNELFVIDTNVEHQADSLNNPLGTILLDQESTTAVLLKERLLAQNGWYACDIDKVAGLDDAVLYLLTQPICKDGFVQNLGRIVETLCGKRDAIQESDPKIEAAIAHIKSLQGKRVSVQELACNAGLSESWFMHRFKEVAGMPVRQYVRWIRLVNAIQLVVSGTSFTDAAHAAGFADAPHLSRTFRKVFGKTLQDYFKESDPHCDTVIFLHHKIPAGDFGNGFTFPFN